MAFDQRSVSASEDLIKKLFNKVYSAIISEKIFCPPETAVYLAAYACQAKFGSAQGLRDPVPPVKELLPKSVLDNHNLTIADWETRISNWHLKLRGVPFLDSIVEYVNTAQDVELYGASIFDVEDSHHARKWISLDAVGLNIFDSKRKPPTRRYVWSDIGSFTAWDEKLEVVLAHKPHQILTFYVQHQSAGDLLTSLFHGSKELYSRRKKGEISAGYVRRSESNSSMRMRPHKLTSKELFDLEQQITELELELPRRATDYEYASWQVKDQLRQVRGLETRLALNTPSTEVTRRLQHRVAQTRVFLEQDFFNAQKEPFSDRPHKYRGNFAIRIGGAYSTRAEGYVSDIDSESETAGEEPVWASSTAIRPKNQTSADVVHAAPSPPSPQQPPPVVTMPKKTTRGWGSRSSSSSSTSISSSAAAVMKMPALPSKGMGSGRKGGATFQPQSGITGRPTFNEEAYPKTAVQLEPSSFATDEPLSLNTSVASARNYGPGYPEISGDLMPRGSEHPDPPDSVGSPRARQGHALRTPGQSGSSPLVRGRQHGQIIEPDAALISYRPPVQPKPKVAPRGVAEPHIVSPDHFANPNAQHLATGDDLKFSSLKAIQSGFAKKRVDLFEAM